MTSRTGVAIGVGALITVLLGAFIYSNLERYTRYENAGPELDVRLNPWHAAQQYLLFWNIDSHRSFNLNPVLDKLQPTDTLVLANNGPIVNPGMQQQLFNWVADGGHLVINAHNTWQFESESSGDDFLDSLGIRVYSTEDEEEVDETASDTEPEADWEPDDAAARSEDTVPDSPIEGGQEEAGTSCTFFNLDDVRLLQLNEHLLQIESVPWRTLEPAYDIEAFSGEHWPNPLLQVQLGNGTLTALLDTTIWQDNRISELDHAYLLWYLVKDSTTTWLVSSDDSESLMQLIWRTAPYLLIALACLILSWGWQRWVRFGPMIQPPAPGHRKITEHIEASARFGWNHGEAHHLLEPLRDDIKQRVSRHCTYSYKNDTTQWLQYVAKIVHIDESELAHAMAGEAPRHEQDWTHLIHQLQIIRNAL
ncbi:DUF4350 domain-containing protein [Ketobacter sp.]